MTAKLLQLVNSAFFGLTHRVTNVQRAVAYLGMGTVRNVLAAVEMMRALPAATPDMAVIVEQLQAHSIAVGELSRNLLRHRRQAHDAFAAGIMHDIGLLAAVSCMPAKYELLRLEVGGGTPLIECEAEILGAPHASIGAHLLDVWGLPANLVSAVRHSHDADRLVDRNLGPLQAVYIAEQVTNLVGASGGWVLEEGLMPDHEYLAELGLDGIVTQVMARAGVDHLRRVVN